MTKPSFTFHEEWRDAAQGLPNDIRAEIYEAIIEYGLSGTVPVGMNPMAGVAFKFVKEMIDMDNERYQAICERNRKNGSKGGRPKSEKPKETQENPKKPKKPSGLSGLFKESSPVPPKEYNRDSDESLSTKVDSEVNAPTCEEIVGFYNRTVSGTAIAKCLKLTDSRRKAIMARLRQYGAEKIYEAISIAAESEFCNGANDRNWTADFDFIFNANKMAKILEGKYSHNNHGTTQTNQGANQGSDHPSDSELREQSIRIMQRRKAERLARQAEVRDGGDFFDEGQP